MAEQSTRKWKLPLIIALVAAGVIFVLTATKPSPPKAETTEKAWLVDAEALKFSAHHPTLSLLGTVSSPFEAELTAIIQADVLSVPVREGDRVSQGQVLLSLDKQDVQSRVTQREADLQELEAQMLAENNRYQSDQKLLKEESKLLQVARDAFARQQRLKSSNLVAQERLEQAESQVAQNALAVTARQQAIDDHPNRVRQLEAKISRAKALLADAQREMKRSDIRAPFDGVVTSVLVAPGERVQVGQLLVGVYDLDQSEVRSQIPDKYLSIIRKALNEGQKILANAVYQGMAVEFELARLAGQTNLGAGGVDAFFIPVSSREPFILNTTVRLNTRLPALENTFTLPVSALYGTDRIYRVEEGRIYAETTTVLGTLKDLEGRTRIIADSAGFREGDLIITTQLPNAISGLKVELKAPAQDQPADPNAVNKGAAHGS
ncbi:MAG: RND transporter [Oleiphilus sp.]|nr:MAG: RND transporter [Oleiphilus sp.]